MPIFRAEEVNGRFIHITSSGVRFADVNFVGTGEEIENVLKISIEIVPLKITKAILLLGQLGEWHDTPDGGSHRQMWEEVAETDQVTLDIQALAENA